MQEGENFVISDEESPLCGIKHIKFKILIFYNL